MAIDYSVVMDNNERQRMLEDGYLPEVIEWHAKERFEKMQMEFSWKNRILARYYEATPYFDFVGDVFPGLEKLLVVTAEDTYSEMEVDELMEYQALRSNVYVAPASFINGCYKGATCKDLYALVVDIDRIDPETLDAIIENGNLGNMTPMPTYIVNSGSGVHFYYVFQEPVPYYHGNRNILKDMYRTLCGFTKRNILAKTDWHAITQPFRLPGSQTKLGQTVTGWKCGDKWHARALAKRLGVDGEGLDLQQRPLLSQKEYKEELFRRAARQEEQWQNEALAKPDDSNPKRKKTATKNKQWKSSLEGNFGFYESCLQRCYEKTPEGTRYRSLVGLTMVAYKVGLPKERVEQDLLQLLVHYNQIGKYMGQKEVRKALRAYNAKALQCRSTTLEEWFGWEFRRAAQERREKRSKDPDRPKLTKEEILEDARAIRDIRMKRAGRPWWEGHGRPKGSQNKRNKKQEKIQAWRMEHPEGKPKDCIRDTGISKNTVYKWWNT